VHLLQSHTEEAIVWLEKARAALPEHPAPHARLAAGYGLKGNTERAAAERSPQAAGRGLFPEHCPPAGQRPEE